jgi:hypothetical protein
MFTKKHGHKLGKYSNNTSFVHDYFLLSRYLAPSFLASLGALGYVGYTFGRTKSLPSSPKLSLLHLIGVAGGFGISFWITAVHGKIHHLI